jgi:DNA helicase-2/ATP-dependent DNA helicase PcrA
MKARVVELAGESGEAVWMATFHSTCARILRQDVEPLGWTRRFSIYDEDDQLRLVKDVIAAFGYDRDKVVPKDVLSQIDHHKNRMAGTPDDLVAAHLAHPNTSLVRVWAEYERRLRAADAMDFNDLIRNVVALFRKHPDVLQKWQERFRYVLVDEYQDTNRGQYDLLHLLVAQSRNLAVVGDDDQSIYGFRGADISNILGFQRDFPDATVVKLEQNYRSTKNVLAVANAVVARNEGRMDKVLWTAGDQGPKVTLIACDNPREEADRVARAVVKLQRAGYAPGQIAIVYRTNATSRVFEEALRLARVPYRVVGGRRFYERREVRDVLGYLRLVLNPADDAAFLRVVNVPTRGVGTKTLEVLRAEAATRGEPLLRSARNRPTPNDAGGKAVQAFVQIVDDIGDAARNKEPAPLVRFLLDRSGYLAALAAENKVEARGRIENLDELVRDAASFDYPTDATTPMERLRSWLDRIALATQDEEAPAGGEVTLTTVHNAKGLEYPVVLVVHMMEGQFPHQRSVEDGQVEEERRLAYVAFTRAMQRLVITRSRNVLVTAGPDREWAASLRAAPPSRFLYRLPDGAVDGDLPDGDPPDEAPAPPSEEDVAVEKFRRFLARRAMSAASTAASGEREGPLTLVDIEDAGQLRIGVRVHHADFGPGVVHRTAGAASVSVRFACGTRTIPFGEGALRLVRD